MGAVYGAFAGAIVLVGWLWLTNVALLFGAELNAEIEREQELGEGVPRAGDAQPAGETRLTWIRWCAQEWEVPGSNGQSPAW